MKLLFLIFTFFIPLSSFGEIIESCQHSVFIERKYLQEDSVTFDVQRLPIPEIWSEALPPFGRLSYWTRTEGLKDLKLSLDFVNTQNKSLKKQVVDLPRFQGSWSPASTSMLGFEASLDLQESISAFIKDFSRGLLLIKITNPKGTLCQSEIRLHREDPDQNE